MYFKPKRLSHLALISMAGLLVLCNCTSSITRPCDWRTLTNDETAGIKAPYRIGVGDELTIKFFYTPDLNETVQVQPDGNISLMFAQDIEAAGQTPKALAKQIKKDIGGHVKHPELVVIVSGFGSQKVYIGGEVAKPGPIILLGRETILQALDSAGWITPAADPDRVILVRRGQDNKERVYPLDMEEVLSGEDMSQDLLVQPGDLVLVPPSAAVSFDRWVDRSIRQALPFNMSASAVYTNQNNGSTFR